MALRTISLAPGERLVIDQLSRKGVLPARIQEAARDIVDAVRAGGDVALRRFCREFDGVDLESFHVPAERVDVALEGLDAAFVAALEKAASQIRAFHEREVAQSWFTTREDGTMLGVTVTPLAAAGIYVPGGRAQYPSTVLMNAIPAKVAGVERVVMVTPPQRDGLISAATLAAAKVAGVDEIYLVGGAQAVAALAYGTESIPRVEKITGPGNAYVAAAKQVVSGDVGIACWRTPPRTPWWSRPTSWPRPSTTRWRRATSSPATRISRARSRRPWSSSARGAPVPTSPARPLRMRARS